MFDINVLNQQELRYFNQAVGHAYKNKKSWWPSTKRKEKAGINSDISSVLVLLKRRGISASFADIYAHVTGRSDTLINGHQSYTYGGIIYPSYSYSYYNDFNDPLLPTLTFIAAEEAFIAAEEMSFTPDVVYVETNPMSADMYNGPVVDETIVNNYGDGFANPDELSALQTDTFDGNGSGAAEAADVGADVVNDSGSSDWGNSTPSGDSGWSSPSSDTYGGNSDWGSSSDSSSSSDFGSSSDSGSSDW